MNIINATIVDIKRYENISCVDFDAQGTKMRMVALELHNKLDIGVNVRLHVKATNIALATGKMESVSISNRLNALITHITLGEILCSVGLRLGDSILESIITKDSALAMDLKQGDTVTALIKSNDISIASFE